MERTRIGCEQLSLDFSSPASFDDLISRICPGALQIRFSTRLVNGWHVRMPQSGIRTLTLPRTFESAPDQIKQALIQWALLPLHRGRETGRRRSELERVIREYGDATGPRPRSTLHRWSAQAAHGCRYDLARIFSDLNSRYFDNTLSSRIRWGRPGTLTSYQQFVSGTDGGKVSLITIAGIYNSPEVPRYAIEGIVFHEMAHEALPPQTVNGRRVIHGRRFREMERRYEFFQQWRIWEQTSLRTMIAERNRHRKRVR